MAVDPAIRAEMRAALRAACDAERAHDGASPCHACPDGCSNADLAAGIAGFLRALPGRYLETVHGPMMSMRHLAAAVEEAANA